MVCGHRLETSTLLSAVLSGARCRGKPAGSARWAGRRRSHTQPRDAMACTSQLGCIGAPLHHSRPSYWRTRRRRLESTRRFPRPMEPAEARRRHIGACVVALRLGTCIKESPRRRRRSVARSSCHHFLAVSPRLGTSHGYTLRAAFTIGCAAVPLSVCLPVGVSASYHTAPRGKWLCSTQLSLDGR